LLGYRRTSSGKERVVVVNFTDAPRDVGDHSRLSGMRVELASDGVGEGLAFDGRVGADRAVVLRRG
jgi:alpha-glucosidase